MRIDRYAPALFAAAFALGLLGTAQLTATAQSQDTEKEAKEPAPEFTETFMNDPAVLESGKVIWEEQCRHCHGRSAYPGKAPKLKPSKLTAEFAYDRVTYGFRKMPRWDDVYSKEERMNVVAYLLSKSFSP